MLVLRMVARPVIIQIKLSKARAEVVLVFKVRILGPVRFRVDGRMSGMGGPARCERSGVVREMGVR